MTVWGSMNVWLVIERYIEDTYVRGIYTSEARALSRQSELLRADDPDTSYSYFYVQGPVQLDSVIAHGAIGG